MVYSIKTIHSFDKQAKKLSKRHPSFKQDLMNLVESVSKNPHQGNAIGNDCYKLRFAITSKGKGQRGGGRAITYVKVDNETVYMISIYDKSEQSTISDAEILQRLASIDDRD